MSTHAEHAPQRPVVKPLAVLIVDDCQMFCRSLARYLKTMPDVTVVGTACSAEEALLEAACLSPDVVLMDLCIPGFLGSEATLRMKRWERAPRVVLLSGQTSTSLRHAARAAGADAFVEKAALLENLREALGLPPI
jgi:DNA-binding NarL/FixJ family response regulator